MKAYFIALLMAAIGFLVWSCAAAEFDYYERFASLMDTNQFGTPLTNATLSLQRIKRGHDVAGVNLGTSMSTAVELWGKPRSFFSSCGGGPQLAYGNGSLGFRGDKVVRITICPNNIPGLQFEGGLTAASPPAEFAKALGGAAPAPDEARLTVSLDRNAQFEDRPAPCADNLGILPCLLLRVLCAGEVR